MMGLERMRHRDKKKTNLTSDYNNTRAHVCVCLKRFTADRANKGRSHRLCVCVECAHYTNMVILIEARARLVQIVLRSWGRGFDEPADRKQTVVALHERLNAPYIYYYIL